MSGRPPVPAPRPTLSPRINDWLVEWAHDRAELEKAVQALEERDGWADQARRQAERDVIALRLELARVAAEADAQRRVLQARNTELVEERRALEVQLAVLRREMAR